VRARVQAQKAAWGLHLEPWAPPVEGVCLPPAGLAGSKEMQLRAAAAEPSAAKAEELIGLPFEDVAPALEQPAKWDGRQSQSELCPDRCH